MKCRRCRAEIPDNSRFCCQCGAKQNVPHTPRIRGNGTGSVYKLPNGSWIAIRTLGYQLGKDGKQRRMTRSKSGFKTKREAVEYLAALAEERTNPIRTFAQVYDAWYPTHRAGDSTMNCYKAAYKYFRPVWTEKMHEITIDDLQECLDECGKGKRTRENMKALCGLLYKYAIPRRFASLNMGQYLIVGGGEVGSKEGLPLPALEALEAHKDGVPGADYVLCQCYLGFRPSEFLSLDAKDYNREERAFVGGAKTEAGKDRIVTVSPKIQPIIDRLVCGKTSGPVFCGPQGKPLQLWEYRALFYSALEQCGIDNPVIEEAGVKRRRYTPHSCRHTFATLMKRIQAPDKDKMELIGHASPEMLRHYQDVSFDDLRRVTDAL